MKRRNKMNSLAVPDFCPTEPSCSGLPQLFRISNPELLNADFEIRISSKIENTILFLWGANPIAQGIRH